jgi:peptidoglycan/LPS O-acetylase OafA/YrhL
MEVRQTGPRKRLQELDGLRGIAALSVVFFHYTTHYENLFGHKTNPVAMAPYGYLGVQLFFIISGFVILMSVARAPAISDFAVSRFFRLYPAYWVSVILTFSVLKVADLWPHSRVGIPDALLNLTMFHGFFSRPHVDGVYWTLRIELTFYVIVALIMLFGQLKNIERMSMGMLALTFVNWLIAGRFSIGGESVEGLIKFAFRGISAGGYLPFFVTGMMLYLGWKDRWTRTRASIAASAVAMTLITDGALFGAVHIVFGVIVSLAVHGRLPVLKWRPFIFFGFISYSLYLLHQNIGYVVIHRLEERGMDSTIAILTTLAIMATIATLVSVGVERPALRWIRSLRHRPEQSSRVRHAHTVSP